MVEDIESFHPQVQVKRLRDLGKSNILDERQINIDKVWADELVAPYIALNIQARHLAEFVRREGIAPVLDFPQRFSPQELVVLGP
jgi:hypothetical protein